ncbi:hypothetical protein HDU76_003956, partial [Blyttiomyces sp. JEL0837]
GKVIGTLSGSNVSLVPGANHLALSGRLDPIDPNDTALLSDVFTLFVGGKDSTLGVNGTSVITNGSPIGWLNAGFVGTALTVKLTPPQNQSQLVSNVKIPGLTVNFNPQDTTGYHITTSATINANFHSPFAFPLDIQQARQNIYFVHNDVQFAYLQVPWSKATADQNAGTLTTSFTDASLSAVPGHEDVYADFFKTLTVSNGATFGISGTVDTVAGTAAGTVTISNVSLVDSLSFSGFNGLNQVSIGSTVVAAGNTNGMRLAIQTSLFNPSTITLNVNSDITMGLFYKNQPMGSVVLPAVSLAPGANSIVASSIFNPQGSDAVAAGRELLSNFMQGRSSSVTIVGTSSSTPYQALQTAFNGLTIGTSLPGQTTPLLISTELKLSLALTTAPAYLTLVNPLATDIAITHMVADVMYGNTLLGHIDQDLGGNPIRVPAGQTVRGGPVTMNVQLNLATLQTLISTLGSGLKVDVKSTLVTSVGSYVTTVDYSQSAVPASIIL